MNSTVIRDVNEADLRRVAEIHIDSWRAAYVNIVPRSFLDSMDLDQRILSWQRRLAKTTVASLRVLEVGNFLVGWHYSGKSRDPDADSGTAEVYAIYLDPPFWGKGLGNSLIEDAHSILHDLGFNSVALWVLAKNDRAISFYERSGYCFDGSEKTIDIDGTLLIEHRYRRRL